MPKLRYFEDYCIFGNNVINIEDFKTVLQRKTLPNVCKYFNISNFIANSIMSHYSLHNLRHYEGGMPTIFFTDSSVIWNSIEVAIEDIFDYYINQNHSKEETFQYFKISSSALSKAIDHFHIVKPRSLYVARAKTTNLERHGDENYNNIEQNKKTVRERYNVDNVFQLDSVKLLSQETRLKRYGVRHAAQSPEIQQRTLSTHEAKYGMHYSKTEEYLTCCQETSLKNCGATHHMKTIQGKAKFDFKEIAHKAFETKKRNGTTNTSKPEQEFYEFLCSVFPENDIKREYKCERYPFHCDFYIESLDLFIELNLFFTHGETLYDKDNPEHAALLECMKQEAKTSDFYKNAIYIWTILDPLKYEYMIKNNLNHRICYNSNDINKLMEELLKHDKIK